ncbi:hypothetical protein K491DRAFT_573830, partial [Lophiostoma macrostomum CBS 122681]
SVQDEGMDGNDSDAASVTSSVNNGHEPFDTFQEKVRSLCRGLWSPTPGDIHVERMISGCSNRVVAITRSPSNRRSGFAPKLRNALSTITVPAIIADSLFVPSGLFTHRTDRFVLRIPWNSTSWVQYEIAVNRFVAANYTIPIPEIHHQDIFANNKIGPWPSFSRIVTAMNALGFFHDKQHYLTHLDLEPRNLMVQVINDKSTRLSGILDWDEALFAPAFMNRKPPQWLWDWQDDDEEDESKANDVPLDAGNWEIKRAFEDAAGHSIVRYAYGKEYRTARDMFRLAVEGVNSNESFRYAAKIIADWNVLHPEHSVELVV